MVLIALSPVRDPVRPPPRTSACGLLGAWGVFMAVRHSALHLARDVGQGFSAPILARTTYVWAGFIHLTVLAVIGVLLLFLRRITPTDAAQAPGRVGRFAMGLFVVVSPPTRSRRLPRPDRRRGSGRRPGQALAQHANWVWSFEELDPPHISLRGSWTFRAPTPVRWTQIRARAPSQPACLTVSGWERVGAPLTGTLSGFARDSASGRYLAVPTSTRVLLDSTLTRVLHRSSWIPASAWT